MLLLVSVQLRVHLPRRHLLHRREAARRVAGMMLLVPVLAVPCFDATCCGDVPVEGREVHRTDARALAVVDRSERGKVFYAASMLPQPRQADDGRPFGARVFEARATGAGADVWD